MDAMFGLVLLELNTFSLPLISVSPSGVTIVNSDSEARLEGSMLLNMPDMLE